MARKRITAIFSSHALASEATARIEAAGFSTESISIIGQHDTDNDHDRHNSFTNGNIFDGTANGTLIGGLAGMIIGFGAVAVPGLGAVAVAGPIAGLISGAITGGVVGAMMELGIPEHEAEEYEQDLSEGKLLWSMEVDDAYSGDIRRILRDCGAEKM